MRECVRIFAEEMEAELKRNEAKGGWEQASDLYLVEKLEDKLESLEVLLTTQGHSEGVLKLTVDIANFAMMIADNANQITL